MEFLLQQEDRGYPTEYLLSRIRGRRSRLIAGWKQLIFENAVLDYLSSSRYQGFIRERTPEMLWRNLVKEYRWVHLQMNGSLRKIFRPFFIYTELRTLFIGLRHMKDGNAGAAEDLLHASLLSEEMQELLTSSSDTAAVTRMEHAFLSLSPKFSGLPRIFEAEGLRGVEQHITNTYLTVIASGKIDAVIKAFFTRLIDSRNIMAVYKYLQLERRKKPVFIPGGAVPESRMQLILDSDDLRAVCSLVREFSRMRIDKPDPSKVEIALYKGITDYLKKEGREPFGVGPILDYLWKCSLEVMNLNMLIHGQHLDRDTIAAELIK